MQRVIALCLALFGVLAIAACSSSGSASVNYDSRLSFGPAGVEMQGFYADWEKNVPMNGR